MKFFQLIFLLIISGTSSAQVIALDSLGANAQWLQGVWTDAGFVGLAQTGSGEHAVIRDTIAYRRTDQIDWTRLMYDGSALVLANTDGRFAERIAPSDGARLGDYQVGIPRLNPHPVALAQSQAGPLALVTGDQLGANASHRRPLVLQGSNSQVVSAVRGAPFATPGTQVSIPVGLAVGPGGIISVASRPSYHTQAARRPEGINYAYSINGATLGQLALHYGHVELRGNPIGVYAVGNHFAIATDQEVTFIDQVGNLTTLVTVGGIQNKRITASASQSNTLAVLMSDNLDQQELIILDEDGLVTQTFVLSQDIAQIHKLYATSDSARIELTLRTGSLAYEQVAGSFADLTAIATNSLPSDSLTTLSYPLNDSLRQPVAFGYADHYPGSINYGVDVGITSDGNVYIEIGNVGELRSLSGQFLDRSPRQPTYESALQTPAWASRLEVTDEIQNRVVLRTPTGARTLATAPLTQPQPSYKIDEAWAMPTGRVLYKLTYYPYRGHTRSEYVVVDTLGIEVTRFEGSAYQATLSRSALVLAGSRTYSDRFSSYVSNVSGYQVIPYELLQRPVDLPHDVELCTSGDSLTFTNPFTEEPVIVANVYQQPPITNYGIGFRVNYSYSSLLEGNLLESDFTNCGSGDGSRVHFSFADSAAIAAVWVDDSPADNYAISPTSFPVIRIVDTTGCELLTSNFARRQTASFLTRDQCSADEFTGAISTSRPHQILIGVDRNSLFDSLRAGTYAFQLIDTVSGCRWDTSATVGLSPPLDFTIEQRQVGDSIELSLVALDTSQRIAHYWNGQFFASDTLTWSPSDSVTIRAVDLLANHCSEMLSIVTQALTSTTSERSTLRCEIFPNPASEQLYVQLSEAAYVSLVDASGRIVYDATEEQVSHRINITSFTPGTYHAVVVTDECRVDAKTFVVE